MKFLAVLLALLCFGCGCGGAEIARTQRVASIVQMQDATAALVQRDSFLEPHAYCSGVWLEERLFITAAHCVDGGDFVEYAAFQDGLFVAFPATVVKRSVELDLALVIAMDESPPPHGIARIAMYAPQLGDKMHLVGHTVGLPWSYSPAWLGGLPTDALGVKGHQLQIFSAMGPGNSGGGVFNDAGELAGIAQYVSTRTPQLGFAARASVLRGFLES